MVVQTKSKRVSVEEFMALPDDGNRHELVRGEIRIMPPPGSKHGIIETAILSAIDRYLYERATSPGWTPQQGLAARYRLVGLVAGGEFGLQFSLPDDPVQIRAADGVYLPPDQVALLPWDETYFPGLPRLVIEVISPSETAADVNEKVQDYLAGGARRAWCVYPQRRTVHIHDADAPTRVVRGGDSLTDELLPGFVLPLSLVFPGEAAAPPETGT